MDKPSTSGFLEALILRSEEVLTKMLYKLHKTKVPMEEKVQMINSLHAFLNQWEGPLGDVKLPPELQAAASAPATSRKSHEDELAEVVQKLGLNGNDEGGRGKRGAPGRSSVSVRVPQEDTEPVFELVEQSLMEYKPNRTGRCVISSVCYGGQRSFCMVDRDHSDWPKLFAAMQNSRGVRLQQLPAPGQVFGVFLEGALFRAVRNRLPSEDAKLRTDYIRLLDTGEILPYTGSALLCDLSEYFRKLPAFAIRCVLVNVLDSLSTVDLDHYLRKYLHTAQHYKVVSAQAHVLYLKLSQQPIPANPSPFDDSVSSDGESYSSSSSSESIPEKAKPRTRRPVLPPSPQKQPSPRSNIFKVDQSKGVSGIRPASVPVTTTSLQLVGKSDPCSYVVPPNGSHVYVVPKYIRDLEHFWVHVVEGDRVNADLMELESKLNDAEYSRSFKEFGDRRPAFAEPVIAKYTDGKWYRAEVAEYFAVESVKVVYVDYGNCELIRTDQMRQWDDRFGYLPYQAILCKFADYRALKPLHKQAVVEMNRAMLNTRVLAKIVDNGIPWEVTLYDKDGFNIITGLHIAKLAKKLGEEKAEVAGAFPTCNGSVEAA